MGLSIFKGNIVWTPLPVLRILIMVFLRLKKKKERNLEVYRKRNTEETIEAARKRYHERRLERKMAGRPI